MYSPYFEDFDKVLGTCDVIKTPFPWEVGALNQDDISDDRDKDNLIFFRIYFSRGRERCSELKEGYSGLKEGYSGLKEGYSGLKGVQRKVFVKPVLVNNLHKKLRSKFFKYA